MKCRFLCVVLPQAILPQVVLLKVQVETLVLYDSDTHDGNLSIL